MRYSIELRAVRIELRVGGYKENVRRNVRYLIELRAVRSLFGKMCGISIELGVVRRMLGEM